LIIKLKGPVPEVAVKVNFPVAPEQIVIPDKLPWGIGFIVRVAMAPVNPEVLTQECASVIDVSVSVVVIEGVELALKGVPLVLPVYVIPSMIRSKGPVPEVAVNVY
jgi:hypothetical protein